MHGLCHPPFCQNCLEKGGCVCRKAVSSWLGVFGQEKSSWLPSRSKQLPGQLGEHHQKFCSPQDRNTGQEGAGAAACLPSRFLPQYKVVAEGREHNESQDKYNTAFSSGNLKGKVQRQFGSCILLLFGGLLCGVFFFFSALWW